MNQFRFETRTEKWTMVLLLSIVWGSSFILMKRGLEHFSSWQVAAYRIFLSFLVLFPVIIKHFKVLRSKYLFPLIMVGVLGNFIPAFLFTKAQTVIDSSFAGMLNSMVPLWTLIIGLAFFKTKTKLINIVGVVIGFIGTVGLLLTTGNGIEINFQFGSLVILATICYGFTANIIKKYLQDLDAVILTSLAFSLIGLPAGIILFSTDFIQIVIHEQGALGSLGYLTILAVVGSAMAVILFNMLIKKTTAVFATTVTYLIPVVAILWGVFDNEKPGIISFGLMLVILLGIYLVNSKRDN